jgi:heptosyltransferase I
MNLVAARYIDRWVGVAAHLGLYAAGRAVAPGRSRLPPLGATTPPVAGRTWAAPARVLGIKFYGLGNIVMLLPALHALRAAHPGVEVDFLTLPANAAFLAGTGLVRRVITVEVDTLPAFARGVARLLRDLRAGGYDTVLDFEQFLKISGIFAFWTGAPERIGFDTEGQHRGALYTTRVVSTDSAHTTDMFLRLVAPLGAPAARGPAVTLPVAPADREQVAALLAAEAPGTGPLVVLHLGTGENYNRTALKRWEPARFAAVADALATRHGARVVFTGRGADEGRLVAEARGHMRQPSLDTTDRLGVGPLAALLAEATCVIACDTSVMHLAGALGTPVVALFGPTPPLLYGPRGARDVVLYKNLYCSPCLSNYNFKMSACTDPVCMRSITVDEVVAAIEARGLFARDAVDRRRAGA